MNFMANLKKILYLNLIMISIFSFHCKYPLNWEHYIKEIAILIAIQKYLNHIYQYLKKIAKN